MGPIHRKMWLRKTYQPYLLLPLNKRHACISLSIIDFQWDNTVYWSKCHKGPGTLVWGNQVRQRPCSEAERAMTSHDLILSLRFSTHCGSKAKSLSFLVCKTVGWCKRSHLAGWWKLEIVYEKCPMQRRCSVNSIFISKEDSYCIRWCSWCLSLTGTKSRAKINKCDTWKWFQKTQSEGVKAVWRFSKGQGNQLILLKERNTSYGVRVTTRVQMSQRVLPLTSKDKVLQPQLGGKTQTPHRTSLVKVYFRPRTWEPDVQSTHGTGLSQNTDCCVTPFGSSRPTILDGVGAEAHLNCFRVITSTF